MYINLDYTLQGKKTINECYLVQLEQRLPHFGILALFNCLSKYKKPSLLAVHTANTLKSKQYLKSSSDHVRKNINFEIQRYMCVGLHLICLARSVFELIATKHSQIWLSHYKKTKQSMNVIFNNLTVSKQRLPPFGITARFYCL